ncbi:MAG: hypothetical protein ACF8TS_14955, partial [Maioricimonas sp. JB049]
KQWMAQHRAAARRLPHAERDAASNHFREPIRRRSAREIFEDVHRLIPFSSDLASRFGELCDVRNLIMHQGGDAREKSRYARDIVSAILPLFDELFTNLINRPLADLIGHRVARELIVAGRWFHHHGFDHDDWQIAFRPFAAAWFYENPTNNGPPTRIEGDDEYNAAYDTLEELWINHVVGQHLESRSLQVTCHICREPAMAICEMELHDGPSIPVSEFICPCCRLTLDKRHCGMAELHYGPITPDTDGPQVADLFEHLLECQDN